MQIESDQGMFYYKCRRCQYGANSNDATRLRQIISKHSLEHKECELVEAEASLWVF